MKLKSSTRKQRLTGLCIVCEWQITLNILVVDHWHVARPYWTIHVTFTASGRRWRHEPCRATIIASDDDEELSSDSATPQARDSSENFGLSNSSCHGCNQIDIFVIITKPVVCLEPSSALADRVMHSRALHDSSPPLSPSLSLLPLYSGGRVERGRDRGLEIISMYGKPNCTSSFEHPLLVSWFGLDMITSLMSFRERPLLGSIQSKRLPSNIIYFSDNSFIP